MNTRRSLIRKLAGAFITAAGAVTLQTVAVADIEVQINRKQRARVSDIYGLRAVFFDDREGLGWLEVFTTRGNCTTEMIVNLDPECPIDPRELCKRLEKLTGLKADDQSWDSVRIVRTPPWMNA